MIVEVFVDRDEYLLADGTTITGKELYVMQGNLNSIEKSQFASELFQGIKQAVGQEIFDFLDSSERYKHVKVDYENQGPMGGKSVSVSAWVTHNEAVVPIVMNLYCDSVVYERLRNELLEAQEFAKSQEDLKKFLSNGETD